MNRGRDLTTLEQKFVRWVERIPEEFRPPAADSPRGRILAAAAGHFADSGFDGATTRAIAESAGVNQAMIHYYFRSKAQLYERVLAGLIVDLLSSLGRSMSGPPAEVLVRFPERVVELFASNPVRVKIFRREIGAGAPRMGAVLERLGDAGPLGFRELMVEYAEAARDDGRMDASLAALPPRSMLAFLIIHAYGALLVEPILREVLDIEGLDDMMRSQRDFVRRALTGVSREDDDQ